MTAPTAAQETRDCECGCEQSKHKLGKGGCRTLDCDCARYEPDTAAAFTRKPSAPSLADLLRTAERERDAALAKRDQAIENGSHWKSQLDPVRVELDDLRRRLDAAHDALTRIDDGDTDDFTTLESTVEYVVRTYRAIAASEGQAADEVHRLLGDLEAVTESRDEARAEAAQLREDLADVRADLTTERAELASVRAELEQLRATPAAQQPAGLIVARDDGHTCEDCDGPIRRGHAYRTDQTGDLHAHIHCPDPGPPVVAARVLSTYDAWSCEVCGARYTREAATEGHPCGPTTPVTVTVQHRPEGTTR